MEVTVRFVVQSQLPPFLRCIVNGSTKKDVTMQLIAGTTDVYMARVLCPRGGAVLSQLGTRSSVEGVLELDAARELGRLCPGPGAEDCLVTCVWGGATRKLCVPAGRYACVLTPQPPGHVIRVYTSSPAASRDSRLQHISLGQDYSVTPVPVDEGVVGSGLGTGRLVVRLADVTSGEREEEARYLQLPTGRPAAEAAVCCTWGDPYSPVTELLPSPLVAEKRPPPPVPTRVASRSEPLIGVTYTPLARDHRVQRNHQSTSLCNVENERFDSPPPAEKPSVAPRRKSSASAKFLAEYTRMNRSRIREHHRTMQRQRMWGSMKRSFAHCCTCCSTSR